ncbi:hypothetical protein B9P84_16805 [Citrobacter braakii]|uniref:hypothetical protein n=1 Tax=Citrobacter braakii TaxID=57706 RepID=UPI000B9A515E|nr:hypothetical protein [Citrobacter braakii]MCY9797065.1 hypothetical protein [Citrobacter braakii]MDL4385229.1 hypothetical protein [Citrobacter braakii]OXU10727.1 hypothetical protein B9P84_16805 [Citrobacter braakii]
MDGWNKSFTLAEQIQLALNLGYEAIPDQEAYTGAYFIKDDKKWIFNIVGLKKTLNVTSDDELRVQDYDVDMYFEIRGNWSKYQDMIFASDDITPSPNNELTSIYLNLQVTEEPGEMVYLSDGMWLDSNGQIVQR